MSVNRKNRPCAAPLVLALALSSAHAGTIYKCTQADGRVAFQEAPCARSDKQAEVGALRHAGEAKAAAAKPASDKPKTPSKPQDARTQAGTAVFASLGHTHPHAAMLACQRELKGTAAAGDGQCLQQCLNTWVEQYKNTPNPVR